MSTKVAVVIPAYRELNELEKISLAQCRKVLGRYPIVFVAPKGKFFSYFERSDMLAEFPAEYFRSRETYSRLMLSPFFYEAFYDCEYILIYQLDAFVFYDALEEFCSLGYDYIGAPWPVVFRAKYCKIISLVGNGGFSLRNVKAGHNLLINQPDLIAEWHEKNFNEDMFFSHCGKREDCNFNVAPVSIAYKFSAEFDPARVIRKNDGTLPFGCHGWNLYDPKIYAKIFAQFGYDLSPFCSQIDDDDYKRQISMLWTELAIYRLMFRIGRGHSLSRYLPTKKFASIRVIRSPEAVKILTQLLTEDNTLADEIFIYDAETRTDLLRDVTRENLPHLIIVADYDASLIAAIENRGLCYGEHFISFQREYIKRCEELFHKLGK